MRVSNGLDADQDRCSVGPDLDPNCLHRLSGYDKKCHYIRRKELNIISAKDYLLRVFPGYL